MQNRRSIRLKDFDYSQVGAYFITICSQEKKHIFGSVVDEKVKLNLLGEKIYQCWANLDNYYKIELDAFILMPNHLHGIIIIEHQQTKTINDIIMGFKAFSTNKIYKCGITNKRLWQKNYYEHVIRNEEKLDKIREYIQMNPYKWDQDEYNIL